MKNTNTFSFVSILLFRLPLLVLILSLSTINLFSQTEIVNYFEDFNNPGYPTNIPENSYWMYYREIDPSQDSWNSFIPGDGNAYVTVDTNVSNDLDWINPFQSLIFGGVGEGHRLEVRMKGAVVDGGLVSFLFTYEQEGSEFNEVDLELVADDSATASHPTLPEDGGWTDARFNTWRNANENTNRPFTGTKKAVINDQNEKISLIDNEFHIYTIDWRADQIDFFIDGVLQETLTTNIATGKAEVIFGFRDLNWAGDFNWSGKHTMVIDYFKVEPLDNFLLAIDDNYSMIEDETLALRPLTKGIDDRDPNELDINIFSIAGEEINFNVLPQTIIVEELGVVVGNVVVASDEITFTPVLGKTGTVTFPYVIKNTVNEESTANQIIEIYELSSVTPIATDDFYAMDQGETLNIRPLTKGDNDSDPNNLDVTVFSIAGQEIEYNTLPQTIVIEEAGEVLGSVLVTSSSYQFTPVVDKKGTITFPYVIKNEIAQSATANQIIEVNEVPSLGGPTANDDYYTMNQGETQLIRPLTKAVNDSDPGNLDLTVFSIANVEIDYNNLPQTITINASGYEVGIVIVKSNEILFTPSPSTSGTVTFPYVITNTIGETATANQIIEVNGVASEGGPTATDDVYTMDQGETLLIRPLTKGANDSDPGDLDLTIFSIAGAEVDYNALPQTIAVEIAGNVVGTVTVESSKITFTPSPSTTGTVTFPYVITNAIGETATANQIIEVNGVASEGSPTATDDVYTMDQGETLLIRPLTKGANDSDPGDLDLTIFSIAGEEVDYNALPQNIAVEIAGNVVGTVTVESSKITFTPSPSTTGTVTFPYVIINTIGETATANQIIEVNGVSSSGGPTAIDDVYTIDQGETLLIRPLTKGANDSDPGDLDLTIFSIAGEEVDYNALPQNIAVEIAGNVVGTVIVESSKITFTPSPSTTGTVTFPYVIKNTIGETATANQIIEVNGVSSSGGPTATDDVYTIDQGETLLIRPLTKGVNDSDPGDLDLTIFSIAGEELDYNALPQTIAVEIAGNVVGTVTVESSKITFTPSPSTTGTVTFHYVITNTVGETATANQIIEVNGVASEGGPTATDDVYTMDQGETLLIRPLTKGANDSDPGDLDLTIFSIAGEEVDYNALPQTIAVEIAGNVVGTVIVESSKITFTPSPSTTGTVTFPYVITNTIGETATANQIIEVIPGSTNNDGSGSGSGNDSDNPVAIDDTYSLKQGTRRTIKPLTRHYDDYDPNGLALTIVKMGGEEVEGGTQIIQINNAIISTDNEDVITFIPNPIFSGTITFPYVIENTNGETATGLVHMIVDAVRTNAAAPFAVDDFYTIPINTIQKIAPLTYGTSDTDPNGENLSLAYINGEEVYGENQIIEVPNGKLQVNSADDIVFIPETDYVGVAMFSYEIRNTTGISDTGVQTIEMVKSVALSTDDFLLSSSDFVVYPNPTEGDLYIKLNSNLSTTARIMLTDLTGKNLYNSKINVEQGENNLNFNFNVNAGVLFLKIITEHQTVTKKVVFK